jgi:acetolactate synthase-1/2/3 large subunit
MHVQELATAVEEDLPVKVLLLDNASLGMVRQQQDLFWDGRRSAVALGASPDWALLAAAFGVAVRSTADPDEVADALRATLAEPGPALLHVRIAPEADCLPMFVPGGPAREMIG